MYRKTYKSLHSPKLFRMIIRGAVLVVAVLIIQSIRSSLYQEGYLIKKILITSWTLQQYNDNNLFGDVVKVFSGSYYSLARVSRDKNREIRKIVQDNSHVEDIKILSFQDNELLVSIQFKEPLFRFDYNTQEYAIYEDKSFYLLSTGESLGQNTPLIKLPVYLSWSSESISWVLYGISVEKLLWDYLLLQNSPVQWSFTYIPWWEKYIIWHPEINVSFDAKKNIIPQLMNLLVLKNNYGWFESLRRIDIGSLKDPIIY